MRKIYLLALACMLGGYASYGQEQPTIKRKHISENGTPHLVEFNTTKQALPLSKAKEVLEQQLELRQEEEMVLTEKAQDLFGFQHQKYQQFYKGIKVEFGTYRVHAKNGAIESINGQFKKVSDLKTEPGLSEAAALEKAIHFIGAQTYMWETPQNESLAKTFSNGQKSTLYPEGELVILDNIKGTKREKGQEMVLAYKFDIYAQEPLSRDYVYIDANNGQVVLKNPIIKHAVATGSGDTRYSGSQSFTTDSYNGNYRLRDASRGSGIETYDMNEGTNYSSAVDFTDNDNNWTAAEYNNSAKDNAALDAHWGAQQTFDYWKNVHGRNSFDGNGSKIKSYVHYDQAYDNAFWNGSVMTYGDGSGTNFDALTSLDVAAHEIGHAVCTYTADLVYQNESGAMNEGFSDIWAATVEYYAAPEKEIWLIGEDIEKRAGHAALRSMSDPNSEGQPDTYKGTMWYSGTGDNGGVHTNSGVLNHWFYLLSVGKTGTNDLGNSFEVQGITIEKAAKIAYRLESVYLSSNSVYADARTYSIKAAEDIFGAGSNEVIQTTNAWHAVGVGGKYGSIAYCDSKGNNSSYEWIAEVKVGSFTNTSSAGGYTDFTGKTIELAAGSSNAISLKPAFSGSSYNEYWKIWIDYNKDGDFGDSGELAFDAGSMSKTTVSGTINIPSSAEGLTTRMRVSMKYNGSQTSCESFSYGEVEDYTVNISGGGTISCDAPASLSASNISSSGATLSWAAVTDADSYTVRYRATGTSSWSTGSAGTTSATVSSLSASTQYEFQVASVCSGSTSAFSASATFTTSSAATVSYCASNGKNANYEWIDYVRLNELERTSTADGGYFNGTSSTATVAAGSAPTIYISAGFSGSSYTEYWKVWIDFNQDGDFSDSGEQLVSGSSSSSSNLSATLTIPSGAKLGSTRMRVSMKYNAAQTACESFSYGEVEDYTVNITSSLAAFAGGPAGTAEMLGNEAPKVMFSAYPNPASNKLTISTQEKYGFSAAVFDLSGKELSRGATERSKLKLNISDLKEGIYFIKVKGERETITLKFMKE